MKLTTEDRALAAADKAYRVTMAPRDGDDPTECMWAAVHAARNVYEAENARLRAAVRVVEDYCANVVGVPPPFYGSMIAALNTRDGGAM